MAAQSGLDPAWEPRRGPKISLSIALMSKNNVF